ncbi:MAG: hypothetical protein QM783_04500 [Phycisphaerales bacterium]
MLGLAAGITVAAMVGPLGPGSGNEPTVRISRPWGGPPEVIVHADRIREVADSGRLIEVPNSAVAGGGGVTIVGGGGGEGSGGFETFAHTGESLGDIQTGLYTEQLFRAFGYNRDNFGYSIINYPRNHGGGGFGGNGGQQDPPAIDPRILGLLRDLAPIESKYPVAIPGR